MKRSSSIFNKELNYNILVFFIAIYFGIVLNIPLWQKFYEILSKLEIVSVGFIISLPIFLIAALNIIFQLLAWPYIGRLLFSVLTFISAITAYASYHYGIIFDYGMMENIFETNSGEALSYLSLSGFITIFILGIIPCLFIIAIKVKKQSFIKTFVIYKIISIVASIIVIVLIAAFFYKDYASVGRNNKYLNTVILVPIS